MSDQGKGNAKLSSSVKLGIDRLQDLILDLPSSADTSSKPDSHTKAEVADLDFQEKVYQQKIKDNELKSAEHRLKQRKKEHKQRVSYASKIYWLSVVWLGVVTLITVASGIDIVPFGLSDTVLITLLTTTTATVLGLFITVLRFLFKGAKSMDDC